MIKKLFIFFIVLVTVVLGWFLSSELYFVTSQDVESMVFQIEKGESVKDLAKRLEEEGVIRHDWLFTKFVSLKGYDTKIQAGNYVVKAPITLARVVEVLNRPSFEEKKITIIPGWDLKDIAEYFEKEGLSTQDEFYDLAGVPASLYRGSVDNGETLNSDLKIFDDKPKYASLEGYFAPDTYRIYKDSTLEDVVLKLIAERDGQITEEMYAQIKKSGRTFYEVLVVASLLEKEVRSTEDKAVVADIFWKRLDAGWPLQADSSVHYIVGTADSVFTSASDREVDSLWNTYKYPGLPRGPISNPSLESIVATIYPTHNDYWFFLTTFEGDVKYATTLEQHNANVNKYLR
jgi:UPF0755 protein